MKKKDDIKNSCKLCKRLTENRFEINSEMIPICESCCNLVFIQQATWLVGNTFDIHLTATENSHLLLEGRRDGAMVERIRFRSIEQGRTHFDGLKLDTLRVEVFLKNKEDVKELQRLLDIHKHCFSEKNGYYYYY
jgi:hypothetical protein